jgi:hypothetical protein
VTTTASVEIDRARSSICAAFKPITWSVNDTDQTIAQVKRHNRVYQSFCG